MKSVSINIYRTIGAHNTHTDVTHVKKVIQSKDRRMIEHICEEFHCQNCKRYVLQPHECFMQRKQFNSTSEKYMFYDFETYLDDNKKHVVNYAVLQDFSGNEWTFNNIEDFCVHVFRKKN